MHARNCRNQAGKAVIDLVDITLSEYTELWNQLCGLQLPFKMIFIFWGILLNAHPVRAELRRQWRIEDLRPLCQR